MKFSILAGLVASATTVLADSLPSIDIVGNKFFYSNNGSQFYIKGVAYQSRNVTSQDKFSDPLADADSCKRDIPYLQQLSTNLIRVYAVNTSLDHSDCMNALNDAGIYVIADLSEPGLSINRADPEWNVDLYQRYTSVVDMFSEYSNVLGFFAGNEVINAANNTDSAPFVKAAIRDTKAYIKQKNYRSIPVGYSASDDAQVRVPEADYFACGDDSVHADFYGVNMYEWCGDSDFKTSGYQARTEEMKNLTTPIFFSEYGCNEVKPRTFTEVEALYGDNMTDVWSGGIVYEYFQEENDYGLVEIENDSVSTREDFGYLSSQLAKVSPSSAHSSDITTASSSIDCPATGTTNWNAATALPPTPNSDVCACLDSDLSCVVDSDVDEDDYEDLFDYICGAIDCGAITGNGTTGVYGAFLGCSPKQKLNFVLDHYYSANDESASACDFQGSATLQDNVNTASSCSAYYSQAGSSGTGSIDATATGAGSAASSSGASATGSKSSAKSSAKSTSTSSGKSSSSASGSSSSSASSSASSSSTKNAALPAATGNMKLVAGVLGGAVAVVAGAI